MKTRLFVASLVAFFWTFAWGVIWIQTGARDDATRWETSMICGFVAIVPSLAVAIAIFLNASLRLVRGRSASAGAVTFSIGTMFGGFLMTHMAWSIWLDHVFPRYFAHGRRLHRGRTILAPESTAGEGWIGRSLEGLLPALDRAEIAAQWRENGSKEHASIAAFAQLTLDLLAVGAPARLVLAAQRDAADEVRHAEVCYAIARAIDGQALSPAPFPAAREHRKLPAVRELALAQLAIDALSDGILNEGIAARVLARGAAATTGDLHDALHAMAADEARHAKDSWDVLAWCLAEGGAVVRSALVSAREEIPAHLGSPLPAAARDGAWLPWGIQSVELEKTEYAIVRRLTIERLDALPRARPS